jgi:hypothetical protein
MKTFKIIDVVISLTLILLFTIWMVIDPSPETLIGGYIITGGWQLISMLVHAINKWFTKKGGTRFVYHWVAVISVIALPFGFFWVLVFTAPFMAAFYTGLCYSEIPLKTEALPTEENDNLHHNLFV